ncbi:MAG: hypothetical protein A2301_00380 [Candidatus Magasanikbacteria bacterium RIFOXYB2_FULL_40_13]|nr:MAG: hypothetical protein A2301_00380 [Candidatus Magasanikbacteria bacterium RIFOXYB2_FULL_40_13]
MCWGRPSAGGGEAVGTGEAQAPRAQGTENQFRGPKVPSALLADGQEPAVLAPAVVEPAEEKLAVGTVPVQKGHAAAAARVDPRRALVEAHDGELALDLGVGSPERQQFRQCGRTQAIILEVGEHRPRAGRLVQVDELKSDRNHARAVDGEVLRGDVAIAPVVATRSDHLLDGLPVVHGHGVVRATVGVQEEPLEILPSDPPRLVLS